MVRHRDKCPVFSTYGTFEFPDDISDFMPKTDRIKKNRGLKNARMNSVETFRDNNAPEWASVKQGERYKQQMYKSNSVNKVKGLLNEIHSKACE